METDLLAGLVLLFLTMNIDFSTAAGTTNAIYSIVNETTTVVRPDLPDINKGLSYRESTVVKNCTLFAANKKVSGEIDDYLTSGIDLLKFNLQLPNSNSVFDNKRSSTVYKPLYWVRTSSRQGNGLLLLRPEYDVLSLTTLRFGVVEMHIDVAAMPLNCLSHLSQQDAERALRALVMSNFINSSSGDIDIGRPNDRVCSIHATNASGKVNFRYLCCHEQEHSYIYCKYLESDTWLNVLFALMSFVKILVILFSPRFIPDTFYRLKHQSMPYRHKCPNDEYVVLNTLLTKTSSTVENRVRNRNKFTLTQFRTMENFKAKLKDIQEDIPYKITLKQILISVPRERLLSGDNAPVGLGKLLNESLIQCQISERDALKDCCEADMLSKLPCQTECSFYTFCTKLMKLVALLLLAVPWILRVVAYYTFEHDEITTRKEAASQRGLEFYFPGSFILWLTPLHVVFIATYIILSLEMSLFGVLSRFSTNAIVKMKFIMRKCFRDMRETDNTKVMGWVVKLMLLPCTHYGLLGCITGIFLWPFLIPIALIVWSFYVFPTINITIRLLYNLFAFSCHCISIPQCCLDFRNRLNLKLEDLQFPDSYSEQIKKTEKEISKTTASRCYQFMIIVFCLISMYSIILLTVELISFLAEIIVYTAIGIIVNAGTIMTYLSLILLVGLYGQDCFGQVSKTFIAFSGTMNQIVMGLAHDRIEGRVYTKDDKQHNVVFRVKTDKCSAFDLENNNNPIELTKNLDGEPSWRVSRLLIFLDKTDKPFIPSSFYSKACKMDYYAVPGEVLKSYLSAAREFGSIMLFLIFILLVVLAFGDTYKLSPTNKLLATVMGGFVPLLLRKVVLKPKAVPQIDQTSIYFQVPLTDLIDPYKETWPISDIYIDEIEPLDNFDGEYDLVIDTRNQIVKDFSEKVQLI